MSLEKIAEYRRRADDCRRLANATNDTLLKAHWLELAGIWKGMADTAERVYADGRGQASHS